MAKTKHWSGNKRQNPNANPGARIPNTSSNAVKAVGGKIHGDWRPHPKKIFFNGGSSLDWMKFKPRMESAFVEAECFHYVQLVNTGTSSTTSSSIPVTITENEFKDPEPKEDLMVRVEIQTQLLL